MHYSNVISLGFFCSSHGLPPLHIWHDPSPPPPSKPSFSSARQHPSYRHLVQHAHSLKVDALPLPLPELDCTEPSGMNPPLHVISSQVSVTPPTMPPRPNE